jgi:DNA-binding MurR/RpiR family transcriptional regulator
MNIMDASRTTSDLIAAVSSDLTPTERRIAEEVLKEPTLLAFGTVSDLASLVGTSRPTIVRFANKLGFTGFRSLQKYVRNDLSHKLARPSERIRRGSRSVPRAKSRINGAIDSVFTALSGAQLSALAEPLVNANNVWVLSGETSQAGAHAFKSGLSMIRPGVRILEEGSLEKDLSDAGAGDSAVVFDFFRYRRQVTSATRILVNAGVSVVAITDSPLSPLVELADVWSEIEIPAIGPFDSSVPVVAIAELLVSQIARILKDDATARIDKIESLWETTEVFL